MSQFVGCTEQRTECAEKLGVLVVNLGTPDSPSKRDVRRYLAEFLSDRRIVEMPFLIWKIILHTFILRIRPAIVAKKYAKIWTERGSPLLAITHDQGRLLQTRLSKSPGEWNVEVRVAMRYGNPSIAAGLRYLQEQHITKLLVLPMYPQYCAATTATVFDEVTRQLGRYRSIPEFRFVNDFHDHPGYIRALANSIREAWSSRPRGEKLLFSFHGIPQRCVSDGDPYFHQCRKTAELTAAALQIDDDSWQLVFQSRFGREEWLQPYCSQSLEVLARAGSSSVDIVCPGFSSDCLETLEEIERENREIYTDAGGGEYRYISALNARDDHIEMLESLAVQHTGGWAFPTAKD